MAAAGLDILARTGAAVTHATIDNSSSSFRPRESNRHCGSGCSVEPPLLELEHDTGIVDCELVEWPQLLLELDADDCELELELLRLLDDCEDVD